MSILSAGCCCGICPHSHNRIMSKNGLISDCHVGIAPSIGEVLGVSMQASSFSYQRLCQNGMRTTSGSDRPTINWPYSLDVNEYTHDKKPCRWLWFTKNRCLEYDPYFPGANACCCSSYTESVGLFPSPNFGSVQLCTSPDRGGDCLPGGEWSNGGWYTCFDPAFVAGHLVGKFDKDYQIPTPWNFNTNYPTATKGETYAASSEQLCSTVLFNNSNLGLSTYQKRVAKIRSPDVWEILRFNDQKAIKIMNLRAGESTYSAPAYINASNEIGTAGKYLTSPDTANPAGGHGLFRYFFAFAQVEFAYKIGSMPLTTETCANSQVWGEAMPAAFMAIADAAPIFSFQTDGLICAGAAGDGADDLTLALAEIDVGYEAVYGKQQLADSGAIFADPAATALWETQVEAVDTALLSPTMRDNLACKDWRQEVFNDLVTVADWAALYQNGWNDPATVLASFPSVGDLKLTGPVRVRGDWYDIRALDGAGNATAARPPSLARASTVQTGIDSPEYFDATYNDYTLQVDTTIYNMVTSPYAFMPLLSAGQFVVGVTYTIKVVGTTNFILIGAASNTVGGVFTATGPGAGTGYALQETVNEQVRDAFLRLTQSVYFRAKISGWDFCGNNNVSTARYAWLWNRSTGSVGDGDNVVESLGSGTTDAQPFWCTNGQPQIVTVAGPGSVGFCIESDCDSTGAGFPGLGSVVAYKGTANILVSRFVKQHHSDGVASGPNAIPPTPGATIDTLGCCKIVKFTSINSPSCPYGESLMCFARFVNRPYFWDTSEAPYKMSSTSSHPIDTNAICCEFPTVQQRFCDQCEPTFQGITPECDWPYVAVPACDSSVYASQIGCGNWPLYVGPDACENLNAADKYTASAALGLQVNNPYSDSPLDGRSPCESSWPATSPTHIFPLGHIGGERAVGFFFPEQATINGGTCCSVDLRYDEQLGTVWRAGAWITYPAITITPNSAVC